MVEKGNDGPGDAPLTEEELRKQRKAALVTRAIRAVTVVLYLCGVFGGGFLLSLYYIIFWDPKIEVPQSSLRQRRHVQSYILPDNQEPAEPAAFASKMVEEFRKKYKEGGAEEDFEKDAELFREKLFLFMEENKVRFQELQDEKDDVFEQIYERELPEYVFNYPRKLSRKTLQKHLKSLLWWSHICGAVVFI